MFVRLLSNLNVFDCSEFFSWHFMLFYSICPIWIIVIRQRGFASQQVSKNVIFSLCQCYIKGREVDYRTWNGWMASPTQWTWVRVNSGSRWWTGRPGVLQSVGSVATSRSQHDWATELNWAELSTKGTHIHPQCIAVLRTRRLSNQSMKTWMTTSSEHVVKCLINTPLTLKLKNECLVKTENVDK